jgi:GntR family transcriptional regulator
MAPLDNGRNRIYNTFNDTKIQYIFDTQGAQEVNPLTGKIKLDFRSNEPIYLQIARQVEQLVAKGDLKLGDQLPTVRELATELRINFNTVGRAYRVLDETRLISTQRGRGTYIWEEPTEQTKQELRKKSLEELTRTYRDEITALGYSVEDAVEQLRRIQAAEPPATRRQETEDKEK